MLQRILKNLLIAIILLIANKTIAQDNAKNKSITSDTTVSTQFNWELENRKRESDNLMYAGANVCSRWIKFSDQEFLKLKDFDGKSVKITLRHSVIEGLNSMKARGVDTYGIQGTANDFSCDRILKIKLDE